MAEKSGGGRNTPHGGGKVRQRAQMSPLGRKTRQRAQKSACGRKIPVEGAKVRPMVETPAKGAKLPQGAGKTGGGRKSPSYGGKMSRGGRKSPPYYLCLYVKSFHLWEKGSPVGIINKVGCADAHSWR